MFGRVRYGGMEVWRYGGMEGIEGMEVWMYGGYGGIEGMEVWKYGGMEGMEVNTSIKGWGLASPKGLGRLFVDWFRRIPWTKCCWLGPDPGALAETKPHDTRMRIVKRSCQRRLWVLPLICIFICLVSCCCFRILMTEAAAAVRPLTTSAVRGM